MNTDVFAWIAAALATWQAVEIWHHGEIFAAARAWLENLPGCLIPWLQAPRRRLRVFVVDLLLCPFCLSVWVGAGFAALAAAGGWWALPGGLLAVSRLANLGNDLVKILRSALSHANPADSAFPRD